MVRRPPDRKPEKTRFSNPPRRSRTITALRTLALNQPQPAKRIRDAPHGPSGTINADRDDQTFKIIASP